jgi:hypothetical protein
LANEAEVSASPVSATKPSTPTLASGSTLTLSSNSDSWPSTLGSLWAMLRTVFVFASSS